MEALGRSDALVRSIPDFVFWVDRRGVIVDRNPAAEALADVVDLVPPVALEVAAANGNWVGELQVLARDGRLIDTSAAVIADGEVFGVVMRDISDLKLQEAMLRRLAERDSLTGLWNRHVLLNHLEQAVAAARRGSLGALLYIDLDHLKQVNDAGGHAAGDRYLAEFAAALRAAVRAEDVVARVGGDEFAILMRDVDAASAVDVAHSVRQRLSGSAVSASIGVAIIDGALPGVEVMVRADHACYAAKANGGNRVELYDAS